MLKMGFLQTSLRVIPISPAFCISPYTSHHLRRKSRVGMAVASHTYSTAPSRSKLVLSGKPRWLSHPIKDFSKIRNFPGTPYFDKTSYIPLITHGQDVKLFCRPEGFGKSHTVSMLKYFHGFEFREQYNQLFKGLDVGRAVQDRKVIPGEYLILSFDFDPESRGPQINECVRYSTEFLEWEINRALLDFKKTYAEYLGESFLLQMSRFYPDDPVNNLGILVEAVHKALQVIHSEGDVNHPLFGVKGIYLLADEYDNNLHDNYLYNYVRVCYFYTDRERDKIRDKGYLKSWPRSPAVKLLQEFWSAVKAGRNHYYGLNKVFMTGVMPLFLSDPTSENITFSHQFSSMCGLTRSDVLRALESTCDSEEEVQEHIAKLEFHASINHFCDYQKVEAVFNTKSIFKYLLGVEERMDCELEHAFHHEASPVSLGICAGVPAGEQVIRSALQKDEHGHFQKIPYEYVLKGVSTSKLRTQGSTEGDISAWRSLILYMGGLTFDSQDPSKLLKISNFAAADTFSRAILKRMGYMDHAMRSLRNLGDIEGVLTGYRCLMEQPDVVGSFQFKMTEEDHRDSIRYLILENPILNQTPQYQVREWSNKRGHVHLVIEDNKKLYTVLELKNLQIHNLELMGESNKDKANKLDSMKLEEILELRFKTDKFRSGTVYDWFDGDDHKDEDHGQVRKQLQSYIMDSTVQEEIADKWFHAFAVVILGERQILMREMDSDGKWRGGFKLVRRKDLDIWTENGYPHHDTHCYSCWAE